jgi:mono/diheme cytochrome c family protein
VLYLATKKGLIVIESKLSDRAKPLAKFLMARLLASGFLVLLTTPALAQTSGGYTLEQAEQGERVYEEQCAVCHG